LKKQDPEKGDVRLKVMSSLAGSHSSPFSDLIIDHCCVYNMVSESTSLFCGSRG